MQINVLYIIWSLGLGGAERVVINLAKGLDKTKFNPMVCCLNDKGEFAVELEERGIPVIALNKRLGIDIAVIGKLISVIKERNIQIVHTHLWGANFWGRIAAKMAGVPVIIATEHNVDTWKSWFNFALDRWLSRSTDKIIAVSNKVKEFYQSKGINPKKIAVIYNGVDIAKGEERRAKIDSRSSILDYRKEFNIKNDETMLAIIGRLVEQKGHRYLFEALNMLNGKYKVRLLVVGNGPLLQELQQRAMSYDLSAKIIFTGLRKDVPDLLKITDILVLPSLREGLPMVALEAMAVGKPIIATNVGGTPEVVLDGQTGILVPPGNPTALADAIDRLIENRNLTKKLGENGSSRVKELFSVEKMTRETEQVYHQLLKEKNGLF